MIACGGCSRRVAGGTALLATMLLVMACDDSVPPTEPGGTGVADLSGSVTLEQRAPVAGATVRLVAAGGAGAAFEATSDAAGSFGLSDVPAGEWEVQVVPPAGFAVRTVDRGTLELRGGDAVELRVDLGASAEAGSLVVEVLVDNELPYQGASLAVMVQPPGGDTLSLDTVATAVTAANGAAIFSLDDGTYVVALQPPVGLRVTGGERRYGVVVLEGSVTWVGFTLTDSPPGPEFDAVRVQGTVRLNDRDVVAGVRVELAIDDIVVEATSDASGMVDFGTLSPGAWQLSIDVPAGYTLADGQANPSTLYLTAYDTLAVFDVALADADGHGLVEAYVVADSMLVSDVELRVRRQDTDALVATGRTGPEGRWWPLLDPGTYAIEITVPAGYSIAGGGPPRIENIVVRRGRMMHVGFWLLRD